VNVRGRGPGEVTTAPGAGAGASVSSIEHVFKLRKGWDKAHLDDVRGRQLVRRAARRFLIFHKPCEVAREEGRRCLCYVRA